MDLERLRAALGARDSTDYDEEEAIRASIRPKKEEAPVMSLALPKAGVKREREPESQSTSPSSQKRQKVTEVSEAESEIASKEPSYQNPQLSIEQSTAVSNEEDYSFSLDFRAVQKAPVARQDRMSLDFMELRSEDLLESTALNFKSKLRPNS